jgi:hypothetical protein
LHHPESFAANVILHGRDPSRLDANAAEIADLTGAPDVG